ncbi:MAG: proton-conducting transporter membrane subunit, partial [Desulfobulbaceae bacterium]|nr:proton-conducting transporter membrane subunit [Desulfobulbaceae bacterium]
IKRMLAYSSVEHMGILAIGVAVGGLATYGAMFHMFNNALTKGSLFMSAGNIHRHYGSKRQCEILGSLSDLPVSAGVFLAGFLAIAGSPPSGVFLSEFTILRGIFTTGHPYLSGGFVFLLAVIFIGMADTVLPVTLGPSHNNEATPDSRHETLLTAATPLLLLLIVIAVGLYLPAPLKNLFTDAAALLELQP